MLNKVAMTDKSLCITPSTYKNKNYSNTVHDSFHWKAHGKEVMTKNSTKFTGYCFMLSPECIDKVGLLDEEFKIWFGDDDYKARILQSGTITEVVDLFVAHLGGNSYNY